jgi:catechol 2,3-dioxygenase-like lactoylglutathione lyase family enzyme
MTRELHHVGYVVDDLPAAAEHFAQRFGAGPFYAFEHIAFDEVTYLGEPAVYDHSSAFGQCGPLILELTAVHDVRPAGLADAFVRPGRGIGHVGWLADSLEDEAARLEAAGLVPFHTGRTGPVSVVWFEGGPLLGHPIEVLQSREELLGFYDMVARASEGWDGSDPYRPVTEPPT